MLRICNINIDNLLSVIFEEIFLPDIVRDIIFRWKWARRFYLNRLETVAWKFENRCWKNSGLNRVWEWAGVQMDAHWVINVYIALSAPVMPILASYWSLPRIRTESTDRPHSSRKPKRISGNPEKYRCPNTARSLIGNIRESLSANG